MIVIWKKKEDNYYYRIVSGYYIRYEVGYKNSYGHEVILIIDDRQPQRITFRKKLILNFIGFLNRWL